MAEQDVVYAWIQMQTADGALYPFAIDPDSYIKRDIVDFAPRSGGGDVAYSNLDLYQLVTQDSWHHGIGFVQFRDKFGYRITSDGVDTRHVGMALMFTHYTQDYSYSDNAFLGAVDFGGSTYFNMGAGGVWKRTTGGTWTRVLNATVGDLISNGSYLIASLTSGRMKTSSDGTSWSDAGVGGNPPNDFRYLELHNGFMWGSESGVSDIRTVTGTVSSTGTAIANELFGIIGSGAKFMSELSIGDTIKVGSTLTGRVTQVFSDTVLIIVVKVGATLSGGESIYKITPGPSYECIHFWSASDSSDAEGGGTQDVGAIVIGSGSPGVSSVVSFNNVLYITRPDGAWAIDDTIAPPIARRVLNFQDEQHSSNFAVCVPWRGRLYFNIKNTLYAYNGSSLANVTPPTYDLNYPPASFGNFIAATYRGPYLYVLASDNQTPTNYYLLAFDGTGWFSLANLGTTAPTGIGYSALTDNLFIGMTGGVEIRIPFQSKSELPYASFDTTVPASHLLNMSEIDFGFRRVVKSFAEIDVEVYNVAAGRYVAVDYSADGGAWNRLSHVTANGVTKMNMNPTVEANKLDVRLDFQTTDAAQSVILRNVTIKAMIRPDTLYGHQFTIIGANEIRMLDNRFNPGSSEQQRQWIEAVRNSKAPITFIDMFGVSHTGYISTAQFFDIKRRPGESQSNWGCRVNLVEVR